LYDLAQVAIPTDRVDQTYIHKPHRWDIRLIRDFMLYIGPISSLYDFLTFYVLLKVFHASEQFFHTGWFVESLATQTLVIFVIRPAGNPLRSRPSSALMVTPLLATLVGGLLPFTPLASWLGFTPLPAAFFLFLILATGTYLLLVEIFKRRLMKWLSVVGSGEFAHVAFSISVPSASVAKALRPMYGPDLSVQECKACASHSTLNSVMRISPQPLRNSPQPQRIFAARTIQQSSRRAPVISAHCSLKLTTTLIQ